MLVARSYEVFEAKRKIKNCTYSAHFAIKDCRYTITQV